MRTVRRAWRLSAWALMLTLAGSGGAYAAEPIPGGPAGASPSAPGTDRGQGLPQGMTMVCPMMAGMSGGMGMSSGMMAGGMSGMNPSGMGMNHGAGTPTTLTDLAQNVSMRDILQIVQELVTVQARMLEVMPRKQAAGIRRDVDRLAERSRELMTEIREMVSTAARGE